MIFCAFCVYFWLFHPDLINLECTIYQYSLDEKTFNLICLLAPNSTLIAQKSFPYMLQKSILCPFSGYFLMLYPDLINLECTTCSNTVERNRHSIRYAYSPQNHHFSLKNRDRMSQKTIFCAFCEYFLMFNTVLINLECIICTNKVGMNKHWFR